MFDVADNIIVSAREFHAVVAFNFALAHVVELAGKMSVAILDQSRLDSLHGLLGMHSAVSDLEGVEELARLVNLNSKSIFYYFLCEMILRPGIKHFDETL